MESKLLVGGKNIIDHTNEQQKMLETKRQEIAEQVHVLTRSSRVMQDAGVTNSSSVAAAKRLFLLILMPTVE